MKVDVVICGVEEKEAYEIKKGIGMVFKMINHEMPEVKIRYDLEEMEG